MKIQKFNVQSCCGGKFLSFKIDKPISLELFKAFIDIGFKEAEHFTKAGILFISDNDVVITGPLGSNKFSLKCKKKDCDEKINMISNLLESL